MKQEIDLALEAIRKAKYITAFTGAGISVESGIPAFRGSDGLWSKYDPNCLLISYFVDNPLETWKAIKEIFYDFFGQAKPNEAHEVLAKMEQNGLLKSIITQNIDYLHQEAGSKNVYEYHGNSHSLVCLKCNAKYEKDNISLDILPPKCEKCNGLLKPDFVFFGESIPSAAHKASLDAANKTDLMIVIGTTGEVIPASSIPPLAKQNGATIIEINPEKSTYTDTITDIYLKGKASVILSELGNKLF